MEPRAETPRESARGVVMAATGRAYHVMAAAAAAGLRRHCPDTPVWLFSDVPSVEGPFDRVVRLETPWRRSKIDAMIATPFERTLYLDVDTFVTADMGDVFDLLDRFDIALAHDQERNGEHASAVWRRPFPAAFPQFNSGVIAYRRSAPVLALLESWRDAVRDNDHERDQPALRELIWASDLRIATLPPEYNMMDLTPLLRLSGDSMAPRIIHHYRVRSLFGPGGGDVASLLGPGAATAIERMVASDRHLSGGTAAPGRAGLRKRLLQLRMLWDMAVRGLVARGRRDP